MFIGLILSGLLAALPQQSVAPAAGGTPAPADKPDPAFSQLFLTVTPDAPQPEPPAVPLAAGPRKKIVCGMTLLLVDPQVDPAMTKPVPHDKNHIATIRRYPPSACGKER